MFDFLQHLTPALSNVVTIASNLTTDYPITIPVMFLTLLFGRKLISKAAFIITKVVLLPINLAIIFITYLVDQAQLQFDSLVTKSKSH
ncbi:hypothetical protein ACGRL8_12865 [Vibrio rumoiensis]|uniref:hypothetical protein n=1 Tax=Vibrio TaxID=662 RepID=UPI001865F994|nr:hypothetical protein [Vibrio litoralis]